MSAESLIQKHKLSECLQCGICTGGCPVAIRSGLNVRRYMREVSISRRIMLDRQNELWSCTTCSTCSIRCPKDLNPHEFLIDLRSMCVEEGRIRPTIREALENIFKYGTPWAKSRVRRGEWAQGLNVKHFSQGSEILYFVGCTSSYDPRVQNVARTLALCLQKAGVNFGILGEEESCCGNEVYSMGEKGLFEFLVENNMQAFNRHSIRKIVTNCPHGFNVFKNRYSHASFETLHHTQILAQLIDDNTLKLEKKLDFQVIYHDPCFLGKQNGVFEEPRKILESIPGVKLLEFNRSRAQSLCCEGGGGRMWIDIPGPKLAEMRVREAVEAGANIIAVACPFCLLAIEDAIKTTNNDGKIQVKDIVELAAETI
ncbi:MAG: (Fe-S)-binding protein [Candidatus Bathyarchaeia archaeon]